MSETSPDRLDNKLDFARALNEALCEVADSGETQSLAFAARVTTSAKMKPFLEVLTASLSREAALVEALQGLLHDYKQLVDSGDCGSWDSEKVPSVIAARAVLDR